MSKPKQRNLDEPIRILVFPGGTEIGLEIFRSLAYSRHIELFGATSLESDAGCVMFRDYTTGLPFVDESSFLRKFCRLLLDKKMEFVFPAHDTVGLFLAEHQDELPCRVLISPVDTCQICRDKLETYRYFNGVIPVPQVFEQIKDVTTFPVFLKPRVGEGSKGVFCVRTQKELQGIWEQKKDLLILEYLPGQEYTVDCFTDCKGKLLFVGARERIRVAQGISVDTRVVNKKKFLPYAKLINQHLNLHGAWFFQVKQRANGEMVLLEIAPRVSGGMGLFRNRGVNLPLLTVYDAIDIPFTIHEQKYPVEMQRCLANYFLNVPPLSMGKSVNKSTYPFDHVYIDYDDTMIVKEQLNLLLVLFLLQCKSVNIPISILTRHRGSCKHSLSQFGLGQMVLEVIELTNDEPKSRFIQSKYPIFIDDSYRERQEVFEALKIPVFSVDMVESLIDWRM